MGLNLAFRGEAHSSKMHRSSQQVNVLYSFKSCFKSSISHFISSIATVLSIERTFISPNMFESMN